VILSDPAEIYREILEFMKKLYQNAELVHADLSEFNILLGEKLYVIDMGQSVTPDHPRAFDLLKRDIFNINRFFGGKCAVRDEEEIFSDITGRLPREREKTGGAQR
jgi:RIO kinase 1